MFTDSCSRTLIDRAVNQGMSWKRDKPYDPRRCLMLGKLSLEGGVAFLAGLAAMVGPALWGDDLGRQPLLLLGALLTLAGLYALVGVAGPNPWTATAFALLVFVTPWAFNFDGNNASSWTAWIGGGLATIVGLWVANTA